MTGAERLRWASARVARLRALNLETVRVHADGRTETTSAGYSNARDAARAKLRAGRIAALTVEQAEAERSAYAELVKLGHRWALRGEEPLPLVRPRRAAEAPPVAPSGVRRVKVLGVDLGVEVPAPARGVGW